MSLYPPSQAYSQVGYPYTTPTYQQPPPQPTYQQSFAPQALFYADPNHFRRDYAARLAQLTFNSRPHIQSLSMIAQDYTRYADIVVQCVEQHIRRVSHSLHFSHRRPRVDGLSYAISTLATSSSPSPQISL